MTPRKVLTAFRLDPAMLAGLEAVKDRDGIPIAEQVRRAVQRWLDEKGVSAEAARPARRKRTKRA